MSIAPILRPRILVMFALALILAVSAYGFAAANTIADTALGDGNSTVSGFAVDNVAYTLNATDNPSTITSVSFDLTAPGTSPVAQYAKVQLKTGDPEYTCVVGAASGQVTSTTCAITGSFNAADVGILHVIASSNPLP